MTNQTNPKALAKHDAFASIALWQFMAFILMLCFIWVNEILDLPARLFHAPPSPFNLYRAFVLSGAVIVAGVVAVGHTYEKQRTLISRLLKTCLFCHRVKTDKGTWMYVEEYFLENFPVAVNHDACPDCQQMLDAANVPDEKNVPS